VQLGGEPDMTSIGTWPVRAGGSRRPRKTGTGADVTDNGERRTNHALRQRIDKLIGRVHQARAEIVEKGLEAVHEDGDKPRDLDDEPRTPPDAGTADARP
jgi:hypothetical protein